MEKENLNKLRSKKYSKCVICNKNSYLENTKLNQSVSYLRKISNVYLLYLKPQLEVVNWNVLEEDNLHCDQFCSDCLSSGQKLSSMNDRLNAIQSEIEVFVDQLSESILIGWDESGGITRSPPSRPPITDFHTVTNNTGKSNPVLSIEEETKSEFDINEVIDEDQFNNTYFDYRYDSDSEDRESPLLLNSRDREIENFPIRKEESGKSEEGGVTSRQVFPFSLHNSAGDAEKRKCHDEKCIQANQNNSTGIFKDVGSKKPASAFNCLSTNPTKVNFQIKDKQCHKSVATVVKIRKRHGVLQQIAVEDIQMLSDYGESADETNKDADSDYNPKTEKRGPYSRKRFKNQKPYKIPLQEADTLIECVQCDKVCVSKDDFKRHLAEKHENDLVKCQKCEETFLDQKSLSQHSKSAHPRRPLVCRSCPDAITFTDAYDYEMHIMTHTGEIPYECQQCHKTFSNAHTYCEHQKLTQCGKSFGRFQCKDCKKVFKAKCLLYLHTRTKHQNVKTKPDSAYSCDICGIDVKYVYSLEYHYSLQHTGELIYPCDICGASFGKIDVLRTHRRTHLGNMNCICQLCGRSYRNYYTLKYHIDCKHKIDINSELICEKCGRKFPNKNSRSRHTRYCGNSCTCEICGKTFVRPESLNDHLKIHNGNIPICTVCGKEFQSSSGLSVHMIIKHSDEPKFVCEVCGKAFPLKGGYKMHLKTHSSEDKPFECKLCGEKFASGNKMSEHRRIVHIGETLPCRFCEEKFITSHKRRNHEHLVHWDKIGKKIECKACGMCFAKRSQLVNHRKSKHKELIIQKVTRKCEDCNIVFSNVSALKSHLKRHERDKQGSIQCEVCQMKFVQQKSLTWHMRLVHKIKK